MQNLKRKIGLILLYVLTLIAYAAVTPDVQAVERQGTVVIDKLAGGWWIHYKVTGDSLDTFVSTPFDASPAVALFLTLQNNYTARDTTINNYFRLGNVFANVVLSASGDSVTSFFLKGGMSDGVYRTFDTLASANSSPIQTQIHLFAGAVKYTSWRITGTFFDDATVWVDIFIPFARGSGGGQRGSSGSGALRGLEERRLSHE